MTNFIYVFSVKDRDELIRMGYELLKEDAAKNIFVFINNGRQDFDAKQLRFVASNTLTF